MAMALVRRRRGQGLGDAASDFYLSTDAGREQYAKWQSLEAALPAGWTTGDPVSDMWGASYYNGQKMGGTTSAPWIDTATHYAIGPNLVPGPVVDPAVDEAVTAVTNAAYGVYEGVQVLRTASPQMYAILTDPEWVQASTSPGGVVWAHLSSTLQAKIKLVPFLYEQLTAPEQAQVDAEAYNAAQRAAATKPTGPLTYLVDGIEFDSTGKVFTVDGKTVVGKMLTEDETTRLIGGGTLTANERAKISPPPPPPPPKPIPQPSSSFVAANQNVAATPVTPPTQSLPPSVAAASGGALDFLSHMSPLTLGLIGLGVLFLATRKRS